MVRECFWCGDKDVTAYAGKQGFPLCTECWHKLYRDELTLKELEEKLENESEGRTVE